MSAWKTPPAKPELPPDRVDIWLCHLNPPDEESRCFWRTLSLEEQQRADRFRFEHLRTRFVVAHGILRDILSRYLEREPAKLEFGAASHGKPFLIGAMAGDIQFNLSHSDNLAICAVTRSRRIGVDVEALRQIPELSSIAEHYFTPDERSCVESAPESEQDRAFLTCWTRKEAYIKAIGRGLSIPLPSFDASIPQGEPGRFLERDSQDSADTRWWVNDLLSIPDHVAAMVVDGRTDDHAYWLWSTRSGATF